MSAKMQPANPLSRMKRPAAAIAAAVFCAAATANTFGTTLNNQFFDWTENATVTPPNFIPSPFLTDANAAAINLQLSAMTPGSIRAVKIEHPISDATANLIFSNPNYNVSFVFGDLEGTNSDDMAKALVSQVGSSSSSSNAMVGNFGFTSLTGQDPTLPSDYVKTHKNKHSFAGFNRGQFESSKLSMSNGDLYPGDPSYRGPWMGESTAPNIRSALYTMPIWRASMISVNRGKGEMNIPWVADFNNYGTDGLDSDGNPNNGYRWDNPTHNQMLSGQDVATLATHYRLRGADSLALMETGILPQNQHNFQDQIRTGWTEPHINARMTAADATLLIKNGPNGNGVPSMQDNATIVVDDKSKAIEAAGAVWSGVYSLSQGKLDILLSNMDETSHKITLPSNIGGYALNTQDFTLSGGSHLLVEYGLGGTGKSKAWSVALMNVPFTDLDQDRSKPGVPEPATIAMLGVVGMYGLTRRRRNAAV